MKNLFLISAAALAFCACSNDEKIAYSAAGNCIYANCTESYTSCS